MRIYVGNLSPESTEDGVKVVFEAHGEVESVRFIIDRDTNQPKGFGFVEMPKQNEAMTAIAALNGTELDGNELVVSEARPKPNPGFRSGGGGGGFRGGYRGGGGFGGGSRGGFGDRERRGGGFRSNRGGDR
ncbi:MAG: RNA-binding protein [Puniceicoccales bacterium]|nr:RNA-binding protein [Puniceicoccales bacterium]